MNTRHNFDEKLTALSTELIQMAALAAEAIDRSMEALRNEDKALARKIIAGDQQINDMERVIEQDCLNLILRQQPVASDLRRISSAMKMITDIERIGDAAADIAEITLHSSGAPFSDVKEKILAMSADARAMVGSSIDAYVEQDLKLASETIAKDDIVDGHFLQIRTLLGELIKNHPDAISEIMDYLMIIKYLERIGDHAVNICEWVQYAVTGIHDER